MKLTEDEFWKLREAASISGVHEREAMKRGLYMYAEWVQRTLEAQKKRAEESKSHSSSNNKVEISTDGISSGQSESIVTAGTVEIVGTQADNSETSGGQENGTSNGDGT
jgi:hypothetical protein